MKRVYEVKFVQNNFKKMPYISSQEFLITANNLEELELKISHIFKQHNLSPQNQYYMVYTGPHGEKVDTFQLKKARIIPYSKDYLEKLRSSRIQLLTQLEIFKEEIKAYGSDFFKETSQGKMESVKNDLLIKEIEIYLYV